MQSLGMAILRPCTCLMLVSGPLMFICFASLIVLMPIGWLAGEAVMVGIMIIVMSPMLLWFSSIMCTVAGQWMLKSGKILELLADSS
jgi:membrane-anchored glycerophosphoryl diester phosphodiesterase (GDPDase)